MTATTWPVGAYWWIGDTCLQCVAITPELSHRTRTVAAYDETTGLSLCPDCGAPIYWTAEPSVTADPRCDSCRCPPTLRATGEDRPCP